MKTMLRFLNLSRRTLISGSFEQSRKGLSVNANMMEIRSYIDASPARRQLLGDISDRMIRKNLNTPELLYLIDPDLAVTITDTIAAHLDVNNTKAAPVLEISPGLGVLTKQLIKAGVKNLRLYETSPRYNGQLLDLMSEHENIKAVLHFDIGNIGKLAYQDHLDSGNRIQEVMSGIPTKPFLGPDPVVRIVGCTPNRKFWQFMIYGLIFHHGFVRYGRPEYYIIMHPYNYVQLMGLPSQPFGHYRYNSILFQILYESKLLKKLPRKSFLPWEGEFHPDKRSRITTLRCTDKECLYLISATIKKEIFVEFSPEQLQALWYFVRICMSQKRVIPYLERWIPTCGARLIHRGLNINTEFRELNPQQFLNLFRLFITWPEFEQSSFLSSLETSFLKSEPSDLDHDVPDTSYPDNVQDAHNTEESQQTELTHDLK